MMEKFTEKEIEILQLQTKGMNTSEISKFLSISFHDAAEMSRSIKQKLNVSSENDQKFIK